MDLILILKFIAGICIVISIIPHLYKVWQSKKVRDISLLTFGILTFGVALWVVYGMLENDLP
ncbi:SemiSWEET family sugar transporter [Flavobacterium algicola]|uniref:SemiSWEET family sugar transporter n=1 Tax=Flavobacterium algicola TaxID=556529 RepID=UPI001EFE045F|nr:SemiSWEET family transporter [Flavobacterium algicola]MCG9793378.1 hypothetical protein [Flavobacterium algicola]